MTHSCVIITTHFQQCTLSGTVSRLCDGAGLTGHFTNHSLRATAATRMFDAGIEEQLIMHRTGHSSAGGVRSYKRITENLKEFTSTILSGPPPKLVKRDPELCPKPSKDGRENKPAVPQINFSGAANFTVNFNY